MQIQPIAIIGAGLAGLACARRLHAAGFKVELFDKASRVGGRMASRRLSLPDGTTLLLDHGAQHFTARAAQFRALCATALAADVIVPWSGELRDERVVGQAAAAPQARYRGQPDMNALPRWLAQGLSVQCNATVRGLRRDAGGWTLAFAERPAVGGYAAVVLALPAEQTATILAEVAPTLAAEARGAHTTPCWAALFGFGRAARWPAWQALRPPQGHALAWLARSRDGRGLIAHATPAWSRAHLEAPAATVQAALLAAVDDVAPGLGAPDVATVHRWRYALVEQSAASPYGFDPVLALGTCGDWRLGPRVEFAWASGDALGVALCGWLQGQVHS